MIIKRIEGMTRNLGAPSDWVEDVTGNCASLPIKDEIIGGLPFMTSAWEPTPFELQQLNNGATIYLMVQGTYHPVVGIMIK